MMKKILILCFAVTFLISFIKDIHAEQSDLRQRWEECSPEERERIIKRHKKYKNLSPEKRKKLHKKWEKFKQLSPEKREILRQRYKCWKTLPREEKEEMIKKHRNWEKLSHRRKEQIRRKIRERRKEDRVAKRILSLKNELGLTDQQVEKIKSVQLEFEKEWIRKNVDKKICQVELKSILRDSEVNFVKAKSEVREIAKLNENIMILRIELKENMYKILTKEQNEKLKLIKKGGKKQ